MELTNNEVKNNRFEIADIYEVLNFDEEYLKSLKTNKKLFVDIFLDHLDELRNEFRSNPYNIFFNIQALKDDLRADSITIALDKFIEEKEIFLRKYFNLSKNSNNENLEKSVLNKGIFHFLERLKKEIEMTLVLIIKLFIKKTQSDDYSSNEKDSYTQQEAEGTDYKGIDFINFIAENRSFLDDNKQDIETIQYYLQNFIFEKDFILFNCNVVSFFYGIKSRIYIDKCDYITIDFYANEEVFRSLANNYNYLMPMKIMISAELINNENAIIATNDTEEYLRSEYLDEDKKYITKYYDEEQNRFIYVDSIKDKNLIPFHKVDMNDITLHPPHLEYSYNNEIFFRNFNDKDDYAEDQNINVEYELDFKKTLSQDFSNATDNNASKLNENSNIRDSAFVPDEEAQTAKRKGIIKENSNQTAKNKKIQFALKNEISTIPEGNSHEEDEKPELNIYDRKDRKSNIDANKPLLNKKEGCSVFRNIDKIRLIKISLNLLFDFEILKEYPEFYSYQIIRNDASYKDKLKVRNILSCYLDIFNEVKISSMNEIMRNYYGEKVAYYFYFTSHYIKWLIYPSILAVIFIIMDYIFSLLHVFQIKNFSDENEMKQKKISLRVYYMFIYLFFITIWALMNLKAWVNSQKYYNYCWGMDGNIIDSKIKFNNVEKAIVSMGIHIPISSKFSAFKKRFVTIFVSIILILFTIFMNFVLFELSKIKVFNQKENETKLDSIIETSLDILHRRDFTNILKHNYNHTFINATPEVYFTKNESLKMTNSAETSSVSRKNAHLKSKADLKVRKLYKQDFDEKFKPEFFLFEPKKKPSLPNITQPENKTNNTIPANNTIIPAPIITDVEHIKIKPGFWYHLIPILSVIMRNIMSKVNYSTAIWMVNYEKHSDQSSYEDSFLSKMICYEFVNYYFYLYYIIFYRQFNNLCVQNNCYGELASQLTTILITSTLLNFHELLHPHFTILYRKICSKYKNKNKEKNAEEDFQLEKSPEDPRNKYHDKVEYFDIMTYEYMELVMNFGYIILFGISSPICFIIAFIYAIVERFTDSLKLTKSHNINIIGNLLF